MKLPNPLEVMAATPGAIGMIGLFAIPFRLYHNMHWSAGEWLIFAILESFMVGSALFFVLLGQKVEKEHELRRAARSRERHKR